MRKSKNFIYKISGTEFRKRNIVQSYSIILNFILNVDKKTETNKNRIEKQFKTFCEQETVYKYKKSNQIPRFQMLSNLIFNKAKILSKQYKFEKPQYKKFWDDHMYKELLFFSLFDNFSPFRELILYLKTINLTNICPSKIFLIFTFYSVTSSQIKFDNLEKFQNNEHEWEKAKKEMIAYYFSEDKKAIFNCKKINNQEFLEFICKKKQKGQIIVKKDLEKISFNIKKDWLFKKAFLRESERCISFTNLLFDINNLSYKEFIWKIKCARFEKTFNTDYKDLFFRWLYGFNLLKSSSKTEKKIINNRLISNWIKNKKIIPENYLIKFPYTEPVIHKWLESINNEDYKFVDCQKELYLVSRATIAEYAVNLYLAYFYKLTPKEFISFCNTKITNDKLYPIVHASGNQPDMCIKKNIKGQDYVINVETSILKNKNQIYNNEIFPCSRHISTNVKDDKSPNSILCILIFTSLLRENNYEDCKKKFEINIDNEIDEITKTNKLEKRAKVCLYNFVSITKKMIIS